MHNGLLQQLYEANSAFNPIMTGVKTEPKIYYLLIHKE